MSEHEKRISEHEKRISEHKTRISRHGARTNKEDQTFLQSAEGARTPLPARL
jgi:hypothetical protein